MKRTKMVCTLGPSTDELEKIRHLIKNGMNVARLNMSHGTLESQQATLDLVKRAREELKLPCAIMVDTCGPELRIGNFETQKVTLTKGQVFTFSTVQTTGDQNKVYCGFPELLKVLKPKQKLFANNGLLEFVVSKIEGANIVCKVKVGGDISDHKSISIPHIRLPLPFISEKDDKNIEFAAKNNAEFISASFVSTPEEVQEMRDCIKKHHGKQEIISKIESAQGVQNLDEIIEKSDGVMVARGDMGTEIPLEDIPSVQKEMISKSIKAGKKVIVATEMLESMIYKNRPTRAETTDVAQAIFEQTDATMLSGETASGQYPLESAQTMSKIAVATERKIDYNNFIDEDDKKPSNELEAISFSACATAKAVGAKVIVCFTQNGKTAMSISRFRPQAPILAITHDEFVFHTLSLSWGVFPILTKQQDDVSDMLSFAKHTAKRLKFAKSGDKIVVTLGFPTTKTGTTNVVNISEIN
jgi:pyruvate kinase